jgi:hypothetical protein
MGSHSGLAVAGNYVYVAAAQNGLAVTDIADPAHPRQIGAYTNAANLGSARM